MSNSQQPEHFASLFVELTGRATIEEPQQDDVNHGVSEAEAEVGQYVAQSARQTGLDDAIDTSEDY